VSISIDASGAVFVDDEPVAQAALGERLRQIASGSNQEGGPRIYLRADRGLDYGRVMAVMGEINRAGLRRMALVGNAAGEERR
jgi:biopolymer transport protein TolR